MAHTINLLLKDVLLNVIPLVEKVKTLVAHFRRNTQSWLILKKEQEKNGQEVEKLKMKVPTRWNSTFFMLQRLLELKEYIITSSALLDAKLEQLKFAKLLPENWTEIEQLYKILKPFADVTNDLSGQTYPAGSLIIVIVKGLTSVCQ